ncbi:MAG: hypothetical protein K9G44_14010 [Melioribacteraceae bacterium]|nr:hypothetical protein [Melioribacteraceae bacterium]
MKRFFLLLILLISSGYSLAQVEFEYSGYIQDFPIYQTQNQNLSSHLGVKEAQFLNMTRLRLRSAAYFGDRSRVNFEYEVNAVYLSSPTGFGFSGDQINIRQAVDLNWNLVNESNWQVNHFIDRLSFRQGFDFGSFVLGRQRISWGTGRIWNPTDLFNPINPASFFKIEKDGADAASFTYNIADFTDLELVYNFVDEFNRANYGGRFRTNFQEFDLSVVAGKFDNNTVLGGDFAGNLFMAGVRGEGIYSKNENSEFVNYVVGIDMQFTSKLYAVAEYHNNGAGTKEKMSYDFNKLVSGEILNLNKNYFYIGSTYQYTPLLFLTIGELANINDGSGFVTVASNYSLSDNSYLNSGIQLFYGEDFSEYWYYSNSFYLQIEYYF